MVAARVLPMLATQLAAHPRLGAVGASLRWADAPPAVPCSCFRSAHKYSQRQLIAPIVRESSIIDYEGQIRLKVQGTTQWVWVDVKAQSVEFARALLQAQLGRQNVLNVQQKRRC